MAKQIYDPISNKMEFGDTLSRWRRRYEGPWNKGKQYDIGVYMHADGARYEGYWSEDK